VLDRALERFAPDSPPTAMEHARLLAALGNVIALNGRHAAALSTLQRAEEEVRARLGERHLDLARLLRDTALIEHKLRQPGAAEAARRALAIFAEAAPRTPEAELARSDLAPIAVQGSADDRGTSG
jgi:Tetratricopeptide repeat